MLKDATCVDIDGNIVKVWTIVIHLTLFSMGDFTNQTQKSSERW